MPKKHKRLLLGRSSPYESRSDCQIPNLSELYSQVFGVRSDGYFVEVGANDGKTVSNTWPLARAGWHGLYIEPNPDALARCRRNHRRHQGIQFCEDLISDVDGRRTKLHHAGLLSTVEEAQYDEYGHIDWAREYVENTASNHESRTLNAVLTSCEVRHRFDVLVVDVEGHEDAVFQGFSLNYWQPTMIIVELTDDHPTLKAQARSAASVRKRIEEADYRAIYRDSINTCFVRSDFKLHHHPETID